MSVTAPQGFRAAGVKAGLKESGDPDVAVVLNDGPSRPPPPCSPPTGSRPRR
jgi:glutamate N-acetyltransferase/amino-acid N-acetyltransferase